MLFRTSQLVIPPYQLMSSAIAPCMAPILLGKLPSSNEWLCYIHSLMSLAAKSAADPHTRAAPALLIVLLLSLTTT